MLEYFPVSVSDNDRLIFYYSGHADDNRGNTGYMQFQKAAPKVFWRDVLPITDTLEWSKVNPAKHVIFIYDCCSSGLAFDQKGENAESYEKILASLSGEGSRIVITAGVKGQKTYDGWFTSALLNGLTSNRRDHFLTVHEIYSVIQKEVSKVAVENNKSITPKLWELQNKEGTFIFVNPNMIARPFKDEIGAYIIDNRPGSHPKGETPILNSAFLKDSGKLVIVADSIRVNANAPQWVRDHIQFTLELALHQQNAFILIPMEKLLHSFADSSVVIGDTTEPVELIIKKMKGELQSESAFLDCRLNKFSITSKDIVGHTVETEWSANLTIEVNIADSKKETTESHVIQSEKTADSKVQAINDAINEIIVSIENLLLTFHSSGNAKVIKKDMWWLWINTGFPNGVTQGDYFSIINPKTSKQISLVSINQLDREKSRARSLQGHRQIREGYIAKKIMQPDRVMFSISMNYTHFPISYERNEELTSQQPGVANYFGLSLTVMRLESQFIPFVELEAGGLRGNPVFQLGSGIKFNPIPGFLELKGSFGIGWSPIRQKLTEKSIFILKNNGINVTDNTATSALWFYRTDVNVHFFIDNRSVVGIFAGVSPIISSLAANWSVSILGNKDDDNPNNDTKSVDVDSRLLPFRTIRFQGIMPTFGISLKID